MACVMIMLMDRKNVLITIIVAALVFIGGAWWLSSNKNTDNVKDSATNQQTPSTDALKFKADYPKVADDNRFVYVSTDDALKIFEEGSGLVFLGFKECPWCQQLAPIVDESAKAEGLSQIYYLDIRSARESNDETYQKLVAKLSQYLSKDENGEPRIFVPDVTAVSKGEVVGRFKQESAGDDEQVTPDNFWTTERRQRGVEQLRNMISKIEIDFASVEMSIKYGAMLLDVRTEAEYTEGHFKGATNLDVEDILKGESPDAGKGEAIYVYCRSGNRSAVAKEALEKAGFTNVVDLGGLQDVEAIGGVKAVN